MGLLGTIADAAGSILGGSQTTSSSSDGYGSFIDGLLNSGQTAPRKEAKTHDEGTFGFGTNNERQPVGTTFKAHGSIHRNEEEALQYLDDTVCYSGSLICPVCRQEKSSPSDLARCKARHRREGYPC